MAYSLADQIGSNNLTEFGDAMSLSTGPFGDANDVPTLVDANSNFFEADSNVFNGASAYTITGWVRTDDQAFANWFSERDTGGDGIDLRVDTDFQAKHNAIAVSAGTTTAGTWYHFAATWDGSTLELFVDGSSLGTASVGTAIATSEALHIGGVSNATVGQLTGAVAGVALFNTALSSSQLSNHAGQTSWADYISAVEGDSPIHMWDISEAAVTARASSGGRGTFSGIIGNGLI